MKKVEELKRGDKVSVVSSMGNVEEAYVKSIGKKFIGVVYDPDGTRIDKFSIDNFNIYENGSTYCYKTLFLGNAEEYKEYKEWEEKCMVLARELKEKIYYGLGYEKLIEIKNIIER